MEHSNLDKTILEQLMSKDEQVIIQAVEFIHEKGNVDYIPHLVFCYTNNASGDVKKKITNLLNDIKDARVAPVMVEMLKKHNPDEVTSMLLTACWSSGIDYAPFLPVFCDMVISEDYMTAFEALTVIDNMEGKPETALIKSCLEKAKQAAISDKGPKKRPIYTELVAVLERMAELQD